MASCYSGDLFVGDENTGLSLTIMITLFGQFPDAQHHCVHLFHFKAKKLEIMNVNVCIANEIEFSGYFSRNSFAFALS